MTAVGRTKAILEKGVEVLGGTASTALGLLVGGPAGGLVGAAVSPVLSGATRPAAFLTINMALDRHLSADQALLEARSLGMECDLEALNRSVRAEVERRRLQVHPFHECPQVGIRKNREPTAMVRGR